jgi:hypothetical protein
MLLGGRGLGDLVSWICKGHEGSRCFGNLAGALGELATIHITSEAVPL